MACTAIVGINWGDEGKGRMVDLLTEAFDIVVRFQGGANAGHVVINKFGRFDLHLLPSGVCRPGVVNILGNGIALDPEALVKEMANQQGIEITPDNLKISERASLLLPWHRQVDELEEERLKEKTPHATKEGIAPFYSDKNQKKTILAGELFYPERLKRHLKELCTWKSLTLEKVYGADPISEKQLNAWLNEYCEKLKPYRRRATISASCSRRSSAPCGTWISASIPILHRSAPWRPTRRSARGCPAWRSTGSSA